MRRRPQFGFNPRRRRLRRLSALAGCLAVLAQIWLPFLYHPAAASSADDLAAAQSYARSVEAFGTGFALCTAHDDGAGRAVPHGKDPVPHHPPPCPVCQAFHLLGHAALPSSPAAPAPACGGITIRFRSLDGGGASPALIAAQPRGPPAAV